MDLPWQGRRPVPDRHKRRPGGQPSNQNARKHGLYSRQVPLELGADYQQALNVEGLDQEIALLRVYIHNAVAEGADLADIAKGMDILVRAVSAQYRMSQRAKDSLTNAIADVLENLGTQMGLQP